MPEYAVQKHMDIDPVQSDRAVEHQLRQKGRIEPDADGIGADRSRRQIADIGKGVQGASHKAHG